MNLMEIIGYLKAGMTYPESSIALYKCFLLRATSPICSRDMRCCAILCAQKMTVRRERKATYLFVDELIFECDYNY